MKKSGFTVIEMLITLSILAILLALSVPNFRNLISNSNMVSNTNAMIGAFNYARMEAIKRGSTVNVDQIGGDWTEGIVVWANTDAINAMSSDEVLRIWSAFDDASTVSSAQSTFSFNAVGGVNSSSVFEVCDNRTGEEGIQVSILISGVIIADKVNCG